MNRLFVYFVETGEIEQIITPVWPEENWYQLRKDGREVLVSDHQDVTGDTHIIRKGRILMRPKQQRENKARNEKWRELRRRRSSALRRRVDTLNPLQWEQMSEVKRAEWRAYRQALLDLPANTTDPENPPWPEAPE